MKHYKKILFAIALFFICGVVYAGGNTFSTDVYYKNVCGVDFVPERLPNAISSIYNLVKLMVPIVIIILGLFDFLKAVMAQKQEEATKHRDRFIRRMLAGLIIFLIMALVQFVFNSLGTVSGYANCMDCLLNNERCGSTYTIDKSTCEGYKGDSCPSDVNGVTCETKKILNATYCRSKCSDIKGRSKCESRNFCEWNNTSGCGDRKERVVVNTNIKTTSKTTQIIEGGSPADVVYPEGNYGYHGPVNVYYQCDAPWGEVSYSTSGKYKYRYCKSACGPTSTAMVASTLLSNSSITPLTVGNHILDKGLRVDGAGTSFNAIYSYLDSVGLQHSFTYNANDVIAALQTGQKLAIVDVSAGDGHSSCPFTSGGHYIVVTAYNNGQFFVLDPGSKSRSKQYWPANDIFSKCKIVGVIIVNK